MHYSSTALVEFLVLSVTLAPVSAGLVSAGLVSAGFFSAGLELAPKA